MNTELLNSEIIKKYFKSEYSDTEVTVFESVGSTNDEAKKLLFEEKAKNILICAEEQLNGRGRNGHSFYSPNGTGLYMSLAVRRSLPLEKSAFLTICAAVAVCRAIEKLTGKTPQIKWVNDIFIDGKKVCGILTEAVTDYETNLTKGVVIGIGINVSTSVFPEDIVNIAGCVGESKLSRNALASEITNNLLSLADIISDESIIREYKSRSLVLNMNITFSKNGETVTAIAKDINEKGELIVESENGEILTLNSGEISIKLS